MKIDQYLQNKNVHSNNSSGEPIPGNSNYSRNQSPYNSNCRVDFQNKEIHDRFQTEQKLHLHPVPIQTPEIDTIQTIDHEIDHIIEIGSILTLEIEAIQTIEAKIIRPIDQETTHTIDQIIKDPMIITKTDQETIHNIEIQATIIDREIITNLLIGMITVTPILITDIEAIHQSIKDRLIKCKQMKKQLQTPQVSITQKIPNYN